MPDVWQVTPARRRFLDELGWTPEVLAALCRPRTDGRRVVDALPVALVVLPPRECLWLAELVRL
jgi:hypothetical protein